MDGILSIGPMSPIGSREIDLSLHNVSLLESFNRAVLADGNATWVLNGQTKLLSYNIFGCSVYSIGRMLNKVKSRN